jgi:hypothetical protein
LNLQHKKTTEPKSGEQPWYYNSEAAAAGQALQPPEVQQELFFDQATAEHILARAGALQEVQGQMLSQEQIEAIAAEIGIKPEFVHLAIEQYEKEKRGIVAPLDTAVTAAVPRTRTRTLTTTRPTKFRVATTAGAGGLVAAIYLAAYFCNIQGPMVGGVLLSFPFVLSFAMGVLGQSRRWGAISGLTIAAAGITALLTIWLLEETTRGIESLYRYLVIFSLAIPISTLLGAVGADAPRLESERRANRSRSSKGSAGSAGQ